MNQYVLVSKKRPKKVPGFFLSSVFSRPTDANPEGEGPVTAADTPDDSCNQQHSGNLGNFGFTLQPPIRKRPSAVGAPEGSS